MRCIIAYILTVFSAFAAFGQVPTDSVKVYFNISNGTFDTSLGGNDASMKDFVDKVRAASADGSLDSIVVRGYASPDGPFSLNRQLSDERCRSVEDYIVEHTGISRSMVIAKPEGVAWDELRRMVADTPDVPSRDKILDIIDNTPIWIKSPEGKIVGGRKKQLMDLDGGRTYKWMFDNLFPLMRNAVAVTLCFKEKPGPEPQVVTDDVAERTVENTDSADVTVSGTSVANENIIPDKAVGVEYEYHPHHFALKNNFLYDAVLLPNLEVEWLFNDKWSVAVEGDVAWWKPKETRVYRLAVVSPEVRYHINPRALWHGMYVGLFVGGGLYQLENGGDGYHGEGGMGGVSFGYMWPIGRHLSLEAGIGAGYMFTRYKVYESRDGHKLYMRTKTLNYFGPLKLKLSIAWRFDIMTKTVKVNSTL